MRLKINNIQEEDFGSYKCIAKNNLGEKEGLFRVYSKYDSWFNIRLIFNLI